MSTIIIEVLHAVVAIIIYYSQQELQTNLCYVLQSVHIKGVSNKFVLRTATCTYCRSVKQICLTYSYVHVLQESQTSVSLAVTCTYYAPLLLLFSSTFQFYAFAGIDCVALLSLALLSLRLCRLIKGNVAFTSFYKSLTMYNS